MKMTRRQLGGAGAIALGVLELFGSAPALAE